MGIYVEFKPTNVQLNVFALVQHKLNWRLLQMFIQHFIHKGDIRQRTFI